MGRSREQDDELKDKGADNGKRPSALDRAVQSAMGEGRKVGSDDDPARLLYPTLWDWMSRIYIGMTNVRTPARITITLGPSGVLIDVSDRDLGVSCGACCENMQDAFAALEAALNASPSPIRSWGKKEPKLRKRGN